MSTITEYSSEDVRACLTILLELLTYLKSYQEHIVLIGGWVPYFLTQGDSGESPHRGSLDIDLALDPASIPPHAYETILKIFGERAYEPKRDAKGVIVPASYVRKFTDANGHEHAIQVDLLSPEYGGTSPSHRHQSVQDILARKGRAVDLAFTSPVKRNLEGSLPNKAKNSVTLRIANGVACFTMKAITFRMRGKEKDAYDLYMLLKNYSSGIGAIVSELRQNRHNGLVREGLEAAQESFRSIDSMGPVAVANFLELPDGEEKDIVMRDVFEMINHVVNSLAIGISRPDPGKVFE